MDAIEAGENASYGFLHVGVQVDGIDELDIGVPFDQGAKRVAHLRERCPKFSRRCAVTRIIREPDRSAGTESVPLRPCRRSTGGRR